jgi:hypothetical protein
MSTAIARLYQRWALRLEAAAVEAGLPPAEVYGPDVLEPLRRASPFYHYAASDPLRHGLDAGHVGVLLTIIVIACTLAPIAFDRRDLAS